MLDMPLMLEKIGMSDLWLRIMQTLNHYRQVPVVPVHGDLTPWNAFRDDRGHIAIVDFERCGWHVPFYDLFHLHIQTAAVFHNRALFPDKICTEIARTTGVSGEQIYLWLLLYLLDYLHSELINQFVNQYKNPILGKKQKISLALIQHTLSLLEGLRIDNSNAPTVLL